MLRLSPRQIQALADLVCGNGEEPTDYRRFVDIEAFMRWAGLTVSFDATGMSRSTFVQAWIEGSEALSEGEGKSGLAREIEQIIEALLDLREFRSEDQRDAALLRVNEILKGLPVEARVAADDSVEVVSIRQTRSQRVLDEQIHTVFGEAIASSALAASRTHYAKAHRHLTAASPDYENAAKEAVSSLESVVLTLTRERDFGRAIRKATDAGLIPRPIDELAIKLFAYRGNEPGVAHGSPDPPDVTEDEALLVYNLCAALGAYLFKRLRAV
jgi:hypothetical protein